MIDNSNFFRVGSSTFEIFVTGLSHSFTNSRNGNVLYDEYQGNSDRIEYICNEIYQYCKQNNLTLSDSYRNCIHYCFTQVILDCRLENRYMGNLGKNIIELLNINPSNAKILVGVDPKNNLAGYNYEIDLVS